MIPLLQLIAVCGQIDGRKKLQKIVHILKEAGNPFEYRYGFHFHGPFSAELKGDIDALVAQDLIAECSSQPTSGDYRLYSYLPKTGVNGLLRHANAEGAPPWAELARQLNAKTAQELESISTVVYLLRHDPGSPDIAEQFTRLKPHLTSYFEMASKFASEVVGKAHARHSPA